MSRGSLQKHAGDKWKSPTNGRDSRCHPLRVDRTYCSKFPFVRWCATRNNPERMARGKRPAILRREGTRQRLRSSMSNQIVVRSSLRFFRHDVIDAVFARTPECQISTRNCNPVWYSVVILWDANSQNLISNTARKLT